MEILQSHSDKESPIHLWKTWLALSITALVLLAACGGSDSGSGDVDEGNGGSAFSGVFFIADKDTDNVQELYLAALDGSGVTKISADLASPDNVEEYAVSPDKTKVAYIAGTFGAADLYVVSTGSSTPVKVNGGIPAIDLKWAQDNSRILFGEDCGDCTPSAWYTVFPDGTGTVEVSGTSLSGGGTGAIAWAPNSSRIAYIHDEDTASINELYTVLPDGTGSVKISGTLVTGGNVSNLKWAPDSSRIAYVADQTTDVVWELYTSAPDTAVGNSKVSGVLTTGGSLETNPKVYQWAPDSSRIAYVADQDTDTISELYTSTPTTDADNLKVSGTILGTLGVNPYTFKWAPDSSRIVYRADQDSAVSMEVYTSKPTAPITNYKVSGATMAGLGQSTVSDFEWAPDSSRVAYIALEDSATKKELYSTPPAETSGGLKVSGTSSGRMAGFYWSRDSSSIAFIGWKDASVDELFVVPATSDASTKLSGATMAGKVLNSTGAAQLWSSDNARLIYVADQDDAAIYELYSTPVDGSGGVKISGAMVLGGDLDSSSDIILLP